MNTELLAAVRAVDPKRNLKTKDLRDMSAMQMEGYVFAPILHALDTPTTLARIEQLGALGTDDAARAAGNAMRVMGFLEIGGKPTADQLRATASKAIAFSHSRLMYARDTMGEDWLESHADEFRDTMGVVIERNDVGELAWRLPGLGGGVLGKVA